MIKSVNDYPVSSLLNGDNNLVYHIPRYQREYSWGRSHWENLFDDLLDNDTGYFLGSIICINQSDDSLSNQILELVDGQQRMTTLSLFLAASARSMIFTSASFSAAFESASAFWALGACRRSYFGGCMPSR